METFTDGAPERRPRLSPWFVTGFCEGEGSFTFNRNGPRSVNLVFGFKRSGKDAALLRRLRDYFGCGRIYQVRSASGAANYLRIFRIADLLKVLAHFDRYPLQGSKARSYALWREAALLKQRRRSADPARAERLSDILSRLQAMRGTANSGEAAAT